MFTFNKTLSILCVVGLLAGCASSGSSSSTDKKSASGSKDSGSGLAALSSALSVAGAGSDTRGSASDNKTGAILDLAKAASITDDEVKAYSLQYRAYADKKSKVAPAGSKYAVRLAKLTSKHRNEDGLKLNFKVYMSPVINADSTADGSIRVYSGLMDLMNDDELRGVIGHEIGHVKYKHSVASFRAAYMASAGRKAIASSSGVAGRIADSDLGDLGEKLAGASFSRSQETEADDNGYEFMKRHHYKVEGMETAFRKLAALGGKSSGLDAMLSSHPDSAARADRIHEKIVSGK